MPSQENLNSNTPSKRKSNKRFFVFSTFVIVLLSYQVFIQSKINDEDDQIHDNKVHDDYRIYSLNHPKNLAFCDEPVPLHDLDVKERFDKELLVNTYYQSQTVLFIKRANRYFPTIERILKEENVPSDFKYLALIESGLTNVTSPAGAKGFWQFMKETGTSYGLEINNEIDERYHLEKSTHAAAKYLKKAYEEFGSWTLAAASYNRGIPGIGRDLKRQKVNNFYDLLLNSETSRYLFRIIAAKEIIENQTKYGFHVREKDKYPEFKSKTITINQPISDFTDLALEHGVSYKTLKIFNPWLRQSYLKNGEQSSYEIEIPIEGFSFFSDQDALDSTQLAKNDSLSNDSLIHE